DQQPLPRDKLAHLQDLVQNQLEVGHLVSSTSPWNTPVFVIQKKSGKWQLLQDLWAVNAVMQDMGALQPGFPAPAMIPKVWDLIVIDLKDCFFTIPLHPADCEKFAFTVPSINSAAPAQRYQWVVLPQGMKNSPTICQWFVDHALQPFRKANPHLIIYHYMNDVLIAGWEKVGEELLQSLIKTLNIAGLIIAPEKVQQCMPWQYLGMKLMTTVVQPQKLLLQVQVWTLHDVQKLVGDIQWVRNICGITNEDLKPFELLQG
ncbi:hypothetical protein N331_11018, partial [Merops nubicus]